MNESRETQGHGAEALKVERFKIVVAGYLSERTRRGCDEMS